LVKSSVGEAVKMEKNVKEQYKSQDRIDDSQKSPLRFARFIFYRSSADVVSPMFLPFIQRCCFETISRR